MRNVWLVLPAAMVLWTGCADVQQHTKSSRAASSITYTTVGDIMLRVDVTENLPNAFGKSDLWGRKRNKGFTDIRYMGMKDGQAIFRRRDVDVMTNETTMNRSAVFVGSGQTNGSVTTGVAVGSRRPNIETLPPDTVEFALDLKNARTITLRDRTLEVLEADTAGVRFAVR